MKRKDRRWNSLSAGQTTILEPLKAPKSGRTRVPGLLLEGSELVV
jgi:hypothetical protein